ncbi:hypothetical protein DRN67_01250 [Candidatus Micrarchaeota archaeon]|nr:MAG: hypothetical protein DRN67_01250 [Candidatus Micrarchaeota archaeon]
MPHKCVRCNKVHPDGSLALKQGCECGAKVFIYLSGDSAGEEFGDTKWIEQELAHIVEKTAAPVTLDAENVRVLRQGIFELDINSIIKNPLVVKDENGVYYIRFSKKK